MPSTPTPVMSLPRRKGRLRLCLRTSGDGSLLLFEATSSPFTALTLIFVIYSLFATSCGLSAKSFISISFNPHHSTRNAIIPILQFRKLREINYLPKIPQLESGGGEGQRVNSCLSGCNSLFFLLLFIKPIYLSPTSSFHPLELFLSLWSREGKAKTHFHMSTLQLFQDIYLMSFSLQAKAFLKERAEKKTNVCFRGIKCTSPFGF